MFNPYVKAVLGAVLALLASLAAAVEDGSRLSNQEIATGVIAFVGGLAVVWATNYTLKWIVGGALAAGSALATALQDSGISTQEWLVIAVAGVTALMGIYSIPNTEASNAPKVLA